MIILLLVFIGYIITHSTTNCKWVRHNFIGNIFRKFNKKFTMFAHELLTLYRLCGIIIV